MAKTPQAAPSARLTVRLTPRGGRDAVDGWTRDADGAPCLKVRVSSPPVEGAANEALERLVASPSAAAAISRCQVVSSVNAPGGSRSSIFVHTKSKTLRPTMPPMRPTTMANGL